LKSFINPNFEYRNPKQILNSNFKIQNSKLFVWRIAILNIGAYSGFSALDLEFLTEQIPQETKNRVGV
jgi:hypothetical protein